MSPFPNLLPFMRGRISDALAYDIFGPATSRWQAAGRIAGQVGLPVPANGARVLVNGMRAARVAPRSALLAGDAFEATWLDFSPNNGLGAQGFARLRGSMIVPSQGMDGYDLVVFHRPDWTDAQRLEAQWKVDLLDVGDTVVTTSIQRGSAGRSRYQQNGGLISGSQDVDHVIDLQLGGTDTVYNMWPLDSSVNRSLGSQVRYAIRDLPAGTPINRVLIRERP